VQVRYHNGFGPQTMAHATRGRFGAIVFGASLTKKTLLLFEEGTLAPQLRKTTSEVPIALRLQLGELPSGHAMQHQSVLVEALRHARRLEVREGT
jgi:hypothetical protein